MKIKNVVQHMLNYLACYPNQTFATVDFRCFLIYLQRAEALRVQALQSALRGQMERNRQRHLRRIRLKNRLEQIQARKKRRLARSLRAQGPDSDATTTEELPPPPPEEKKEEQSPPALVYDCTCRSATGRGFV